MSTYASLGTLKEALGIGSDDALDDSVLRSCIFRASAAVDAWLDRNRTGYVGIAASSNSRSSVGSNTRVYDGTGDDTLFIDDFTSIEAVSVDGESISSNYWRAWPYNETPKRALIYESPSPTRIGTGEAVWVRGTANVGVRGYAGIAHVPDDVEQTTIAIAVIYWRRYQSGEFEPLVVARSTGGVQSTSTAVILDPQVEAILSTGLQGWQQSGVWGG